MNEITIITAFFDIGRENFNIYARSNDKYFKYFKVWGKIKNNIVVYTDSYMAEKVKEFRTSLGLMDKTKIVIIEDVYSIEKDLLDKMKEISEDRFFKDFRLLENAVSNNYKYDYIMLLKYWCLADAFENEYIKTNMVAWMDFGFNHGNVCYIKEDEFNFEWKVDLDNNKIHLFTLDKKIEKPIFELVRTFDDYIMGCLIILPKELCTTFWKLIKDAIISLVSVGFIDDDQLLLLMAYRSNKEIFELHISDWFYPLKENGGQHLTTRKKEEVKKTVIQKAKECYIKNKRIQKYKKKVENILKNN